MANIPPWYLCTDEEIEALAAADVHEPGFPHDADPNDPRLEQKPTIFLAPGAEPVYTPLRDPRQDDYHDDRHDDPDHDPTPGLRYTPPALPDRGWTPERQRQFVAAIAEGHTIESACRAVKLSVQSAYKLRHSARGAAFALGWNAAVLLQRDKLADALVSRVFDGQESVVRRADGSETVRHFYDNRLAQATLTRLDRLASEQAASGGDHAARMVAQDFEAYLDVLEGEAASARSALFLARRTPPAALAGEEEAPAAPLFAPIAALLRADRYVRAGAALPQEIHITDLDYAERHRWTADQWQRADAAGILAALPPAAAVGEENVPSASGTPEPEVEHPKSNVQPPQPPRPTTGLKGRVWWDEAQDMFFTNFPPPEDFVGYERGRWGDPGYQRQLEEMEEDVIIAVTHGSIHAATAAGIEDAKRRDQWLDLLRHAEPEAVGLLLGLDHEDAADAGDPADPSPDPAPPLAAPDGDGDESGDRHVDGSGDEPVEGLVENIVGEPASPCLEAGHAEEDEEEMTANLLRGDYEIKSVPAPDIRQIRRGLEAIERGDHRAALAALQSIRAAQCNAGGVRRDESTFRCPERAERAIR